MSVGILRAKYIEEALLPSVAIDGQKNAEFVTRDNVVVRLEFISGINNAGQNFFEELDKYCLSHYGMGFKRYESEWMWRMPQGISDFWYIVKMKKV